MKDKKFKLSANLINEYRSFIFLALILIIGLFVERFYSAYNISAATGNGTLVIWLGLGFTVCMIAGHMDLTIMYMSTLGALLTLGLHAQQGLPWGVAILIATLVGVLVGLINGLLVTQLKLPAFIATLGMQFVLKGTMYIYTGGEELSIGRDYDFSDFLNSNPIPFIPFSAYFLIATVAIIIVMIIFNYTRFGRNIYMIGGNLETAWLAGIKSNFVTVMAFVISAASCALGGALNGIYSGTAGITMGEKGISPLMIAFTATIIGGTATTGGKGSVVYTWVSLIAIALLKSIFKKTEMQVLVIAAILIICIVYETLAMYNRNKTVGTRPNLHNEYLKEHGKN
ncbi:MAG: ABC transporter permease [Lachnospiraceae bacterium]|jgi:ribose/xylose/arabinose/galactoside ABC-type transport system permease subunit|nr:ABC transporter permease [Lachnospiraceae bacterium]MDD3615286.1 ABC transporter permease [Lachnospiraceae bacterium]